MAVPALYRADFCTGQGHGVKAGDTQIGDVLVLGRWNTQLESHNK